MQEGEETIIKEAQQESFPEGNCTLRQKAFIWTTQKKQYYR